MEEKKVYEPLPLGIVAGCDKCNKHFAKWILNGKWLCNECKEKTMKGKKVCQMQHQN